MRLLLDCEHRPLKSNSNLVPAMHSAAGSRGSNFCPSFCPLELTQGDLSRSDMAQIAGADVIELGNRRLLTMSHPRVGRNAVVLTVLGTGYLGVWAARDQSLCELGACSTSPFHRSVLTGMCRTRRSSRIPRHVGRGGVRYKGPLSGGQSCTPGWRSQQRGRLPSGLEAGRVSCGGPRASGESYAWQ